MDDGKPLGYTTNNEDISWADFYLNPQTHHRTCAMVYLSLSDKANDGIKNSLLSNITYFLGAMRNFTF
jgi:hypothetical protein